MKAPSAARLVVSLPVGLWLVALALVFAALREVLRPLPMQSVQARRLEPAPAAAVAQNRQLLRRQAAELRQRNPFRLERAPTTPFVGVVQVPGAVPDPAQVAVQARPALRVGGIVGGPPWKAVIEGIPGQEAGVLLSVGEERHGFRLEWVRGDSVKVTTPDMTLVLGLKQAWR